MKLLDQTYLRDNVDYSFGDQSGIHLFSGYMKKANANNLEFLDFCEKVSKSRDWMTVFIDNIRLYQSSEKRYTNMEMMNERVKLFKDEKLQEFKNQDLLRLLGEVKNMKFIVFTGFEDTPIAEDISERIPENVLGIYGSNCKPFNDKIKPLPYGIQRKLNPEDNRHDIILNYVNVKNTPNNLVYLNHNVGTNPERKKINEFFQNKTWATIDSPSQLSNSQFEIYLKKIKSHYFMVCPEGNAPGCDCHRDWEVIYMRTVPIVLDSPYLRKIFENIPVLFVNSYTDVNEILLHEKMHLWHEMQSLDLDKLNYKFIFEEIIKLYS